MDIIKAFIKNMRQNVADSWNVILIIVFSEYKINKKS